MTIHFLKLMEAMFLTLRILECSLIGFFLRFKASSLPDADVICMKDPIIQLKTVSKELANSGFGWQH